MNVRKYLKCEVCGTVTLVRTQIGWLDQHPIRVYCGSCSILMSGNVFLNQEEVTCEFQFSNASIVSEESPQFYIEASGELLTEKLQVANFDNEYNYSLPPFFVTLGEMGQENYQRFVRRTQAFIHLVKKDWPRVRRINELWLNGKIDYLIAEVHQILPKDKFPMNNDLEYVRGVHQVNLFFLTNILEDSFYKETTHFIWKQIDTLAKNDTRSLFELAKDFGDYGLLHLYEEKIFGIISQFVDKFQFLIPAFSLRFYSVENEKLFEGKGTTAASFEDLKQFYLDCYEVAGEISRLIVAYNNLKIRNNYKEMTDRRRDVKTIEDYDKKSKGARIGFVNGEEDFDCLIYPNLDNRIRNAIGHSTCKFDGIKQLITYYPSGNESSEDKNEMYLLQFCQNCLNLFQSIMNLAELVYQTRKMFFLTEGCIPMDPSVFSAQKKIGRNNLCPCGSGKKYKKCCGGH